MSPTKQALRKLVAEKLKDIDASSLSAQGRQVALALRQSAAYKNATKIAVYLHMDRAEARTDTIIANAFEDHKRLFLPQIVSQASSSKLFDGQKTHLRMLECKTRADVEKLLPQGKYNIREPQSGTDAFDAGGLDLIILPGVAFTERCERLGHGKGYYDSYIEEHQQKFGYLPNLIGIGLKEQLLDEIPMEPHDKVLDAVVIGNGGLFLSGTDS